MVHNYCYLLLQYPSYLEDIYWLLFKTIIYSQVLETNLEDKVVNEFL